VFVEMRGLGWFGIALLLALAVGLAWFSLMLPAKALDGRSVLGLAQHRVIGPALRIATGVVVVPMVALWGFEAVSAELLEQLPSTVTGAVVRALATAPPHPCSSGSCCGNVPIRNAHIGGASLCTPCRPHAGWTRRRWSPSRSPTTALCWSASPTTWQSCRPRGLVLCFHGGLSRSRSPRCAAGGPARRSRGRGSWPARRSRRAEGGRWSGPGSRRGRWACRRSR